jgi:hypothetical protein
MTGAPDDKDAAQPSRDEEPARDPDELFRGLEGQERRVTLSWFEEHLPEMRRAAFGNRLLYQAIAFCVVVGLLAHVGGYLLRSSATDLVGLLADLLYALGYALWTGAVVVTLLDVVPKVKQRQFKQALHAYEQARRETGEQTPDERDEASSANEGSTLRDRHHIPED